MPQDKIISFLLRYPDYFIDSISYQYPFTKAELQKHKDKVSWWLISYNLNIDWTYEFISEFQEQIIWKAFTINANAFKDMSLIDVFSDKINWNSSDIKSRRNTIASNEGIRWDMETIEKYESKIDFESLSANSNVEWSEVLLDKYLYKWDFVRLCNNDSIPWTIELFEKYLNENYLDEDCITLNESLVTLEFIEKYKHKFSWYKICLNNKLPWKEKKLLEIWNDNIDWTAIAQNETLFREDKNFFHKHYNKWQEDKMHKFSCLSGNYAMPWSKTLIEYNKQYLNWNYLCANEGILWDIDLINHFSEYIQWGGLVPCYDFDYKKREQVLVEGIQEIKSGLIENKSVMWSIEFLEKFETKLTPELMWKNAAIWEKAFKPNVDERMIDEIIRLMEISKKQ